VKVYKTTLANAQGNNIDTRLILSPTPERALAKAHKLYTKRFYSWNVVTVAHAEELGDAIPAGGPVRV
jgi:hypothetical protein